MPFDMDKIALFIDGFNTHRAVKTLGFDIDYKLLLKTFQSRGNLVRASYYTAIEDQEFSSLRPLIDWLDYNGFNVVTKPAKEFVDENGHRRIKRHMDVEIAVDAMDLAPSVDEIFLFSGDVEFRSMVAAIQRKGVRVTVVSTMAIIADDLRRQADEFLDMATLQHQIGRAPAERPVRRAEV